MVRSNDGKDKGPYNNRTAAKGGNRTDGLRTNTTRDTKFNLLSVGKIQATFSMVLDQIALFVQQTYDHGVTVAESLRNMSLQVLTKPSLKHVDPNATPDVQAHQTIEHLEDYRTNLKIYAERQQKFEFNMSKAFALIYDVYCAKPMQDRIDEKMTTILP